MKPVKGFSKQYKVSRTGVIKSSTGAVRKSRTDKDGYSIIDLRKNGKRKTMFVHKIVADAYGKKGKQVNHKNADKQDNRLGNLESTSPKENTAHAIKNKLYGRNSSGGNVVVKSYKRKVKGRTITIKGHKRSKHK